MAFDLDRDTTLRLAERMLMMRRFEETVFDLAQKKLVVGLYHLYIGQEAGGAGVLEALGPDDRLLSNHRSHGHVIGRGADPGRALAEILGRAGGLTGGRGGSVHLCDPAHGFLQTSAILGGNLGLALGAGYGLKRAGRGQVVTVFFGDAAIEEGVAHEVMNLAALQKLPILFVLENNNLGALSLHQGGFSAANTAVKDFQEIPALYGIAAQQFRDGNDIAAILAGARKAVAACRAGRGPVFLEVMSVKWPGGNRIWPEMVTGLTDLAKAWGDHPIEGAHAEWIARHDPVLRLARDAVAAGVASKAELLRLDETVCRRMAEAARFAADSPLPDPATAAAHLFA